MNLRRACEHGRYEQHWEEIGAVCSGGTEPTTDELLAMLVEEGVLERETRLFPGLLSGRDRLFDRWRSDWQEATP